MLEICWKNVRDMLEVSWGYDRDMLRICWRYVGVISEKYIGDILGCVKYMLEVC